MRVTTNSIINNYSSNLADISSRQQKDTIRMYTGKQIVDMSDDPGAVINIQYFDQTIGRATNYLHNATTAIDELINSGSVLEQFSNTLGDVRHVGTDALLPDNSDKLPMLATNIRSLLTTLLGKANTNYNGMYSFSGTKTSAQSLVPTPPEVTTEPFEIITDPPTLSNPSGLRVSFKGNEDSRLINIGANATEQVNAQASDIFGTAGTQIFTDVIKIYNKLMYNPDGTQRSSTSPALTTNDTHDMQDLLSKISDAADLVDRGTAGLAVRQIRLEALQEQITEDITRTKDMRSNVQDADVAQTIMNLNKDQMALQYAMQAGTQLFGKTLMDFLG